jgi:hypothetical protein
MKATATIHSVEHFENRSNVTLNISGYGDEYVIMCNKVTAICRKYNAQENIYNNASHLKYDKEGNVIGFTNGNSGGTITFHSHSCEPKKAVEELLNEVK